MKLYLGLTECALPRQRRLFSDLGARLFDLTVAGAAYRAAAGDVRGAYEWAEYHFPQTLADFLGRGELPLKALAEVAAFLREKGGGEIRGPGGERVWYDPREIRLLPPLVNPERSFVVGFSDRARLEALPEAEIPTGFYKLPQTFVTSGAPVVWPKFSEDLDADACMALIIGKPGRRIPANKAWEHIAGATLLIDITARDINGREGRTTNNLLGKNFPSSTCLGPCVLLNPARKDLEALEVELAVDGNPRQKLTLRDCVFTVEEIVARFSMLGIQPGDFFAIGASMALKGERLQNPVPLKVGSTLRCFSPAIGELTHQIVSAGAPRP